MSNSAEYDPLALLTNKGDRKPRFLSKIYNPVACTAAGFGLGILLNWAFRRPLFSGIQRHVAFAGIGLGVGLYVDKKREEILATQDAILRHYIELHREDFPIEKRTKYGDVLEPWAPIR